MTPPLFDRTESRGDVVGGDEGGGRHKREHGTQPISVSTVGSQLVL